VSPAGSDLALLVGTQKGLFIATPQQSGWRLDGPHIAGYEIIHTLAPPGAPGVFYAAASHKIWGTHIYRSEDGGQSWNSLPTAPQHAPGTHRTALKAIWYLAAAPGGRLYAGIDPAGLFSSDDRGASWQPVAALNEHPTRDTWEPARGGFSVHSIRIDPANPARLWVAVSAGGVYRSEDGGASWTPANNGVRAENLPNPYPETGHNVHRLVMHPARPERLYRQCYHGTWRSDDGGRHWIEITAGLPGNFGYAIAVDPRDPDTVFQVPESDSHMRTVVDGRLRVYRSRDAGDSWESASTGLPQAHAWVTVLREALDTDDSDPCGVYFGTSGGHLFASRDGADSWTLAAGFLPRILSVKAVRGTR
jgi:photosystem II stability/assembly factor-like uncharacterized protein